MTPREIERLTRVVVDARRAGRSDAEIAWPLARACVLEGRTGDVVESIEGVFQHGTLAVVTGGLSSAELPPGEGPFFDADFVVGRAAMRRA